MTPPTTDTSREAVELACEHVETHERNLNNGFPMTCEIGSDIQSLISVCRAVAEERDTLVAERDAMRDQLAADRDAALEEVFNHFEPDELDGESTREHCEYAQREIRALKSTTPATREVTVQEAALLSPIATLLPDAVEQAEKAMRKFPQPNYIISKWAEESGEVTKALIHAAEGRETWENIRGELVDTLAMLHRLFVEGDKVHGLPPLRALANEEQSDG
jgi:hypothetical protein